MIGKLVGIIAMNIVFFAWMVLERLRVSKFAHMMMEKIVKKLGVVAELEGVG